MQIKTCWEEALTAGTLKRIQFHFISVKAWLSYWASEGYWIALKGERAVLTCKAGGPVHYIWYELDILDIFSKYTLKITQIYLNMLKYTQKFPCGVGIKVYQV